MNTTEVDSTYTYLEAIPSFKCAVRYFMFLLQGMLVNGFVNVVITTLERRFDLRSAESGFIASSYDVGSLLTVIPISYFGGLVGASKPR